MTSKIERAREYGDPARNAEIRRLRQEGWTVVRLAERFGISPGRVSMIAPRRRTEPPARKCPRPPCVERRPHEHCAACGLIVRPDRRLCELCEREAHRALLVATGRRDLADRLRTTEGDELLGRILNALSGDREMWEVA